MQGHGSMFYFGPGFGDSCTDDDCADCCSSFWCLPCSVCQDAREITIRGPGMLLPKTNHSILGQWDITDHDAQQVKLPPHQELSSSMTVMMYRCMNFYAKHVLHIELPDDKVGYLPVVGSYIKSQWMLIICAVMSHLSSGLTKRFDTPEMHTHQRSAAKTTMHLKYPCATTSELAVSHKLATQAMQQA